MKVNKILKFGGTSVGSIDSLKVVLDIIKTNKSKNYVYVFSAQSGITNLLVEICNTRLNKRDEIIRTIKHKINSIMNGLEISSLNVTELYKELEEISLNEDITIDLRDEVLSFGERISCNLITELLIANNLNALFIDSRELIETNNNFGSAEYNFDKTYQNTSQYFTNLAEGYIPVVTGFIAKSESGKTSTLGRGGSDLTATILGRALEVAEVQIWTDADGIMSADPKKVKNAKSLKNISYLETYELSNFGGKVMYSKSIYPAQIAQIPIKVLNTFNKEYEGTTIGVNSDKNFFAVTSKGNITLLTITSSFMIGTVGYLSNLFTIFSNLNLSIDLVSVSEASISVTFDSILDLEIIKTQLESIGSIRLKTNMSQIAIISNTINTTPQLITTVIEALNSEQSSIELISLSNSGLNLSLVTNSENLETTINNIYNKVDVLLKQL